MCATLKELSLRNPNTLWGGARYLVAGFLEYICVSLWNKANPKVGQSVAILERNSLNRHQKFLGMESELGSSVDVF